MLKISAKMLLLQPKPAAANGWISLSDLAHGLAGDIDCIRAYDVDCWWRITGRWKIWDIGLLLVLKGWMFAFRRLNLNCTILSGGIESD